MKLPISYDVDITQPLFPVPLQSMLITADEYANQITVNLFQGKTPYSPGGTCAGFVVRKDGATMAFSGSISGNALTITLPPAAYAIEGPINIGVKSIADGQKTTVFLGIGTVSNGETGVAVDPGTIIPSVTALIAAIDAAVSSIPADYSMLLATVAPTYSTSATYAAGDYVWYSGTLYRAKQDIITAESWTAAHWEVAVIGDDVADLKSATDDMVVQSTNLLDPTLFQTGKYVVAGGGLDSNANLTASGFFPVSPSTTYYMYRSDTYSVRVAYYTKNDESGYISMDSSISSTTPGFTTPATAKYARLSTNKTMILDMGVYATDIKYYIPYQKYLSTRISIGKQIDKTLTVEGKAADAKAVGDIVKYVVTPEKCCKYGDPEMHTNERLDLDTGAVVTNSSNMCRSDYIPVSAGDYVYTCAVRYICLYAADYTYLGYINLYTTSTSYNTPPATWSGNFRSNLTQMAAVNNVDPAFIRVWASYNQAYVPAVTVLSDDDYMIVNLGDSIFGNNEKPCDLGTYIQNITGMKTANCAYGGTTARVIPSGNMAPLGLPSIVDCIVAEDFTDLKTPEYWASLSESMYTVPTLLFPMIDFAKVKIITIAYGTNDYNSNTPIDNENDKFDTSTYCGGLRYAIKNLLQKYPEITIVLLSPIYRYWSDSADYSTVDRDSDSRENTLNLKLIDYVNAMKSVAEEYHVPYFDNYTMGGLNQYTAPAWLRDGTHLNRSTGVDKLGHIIAREVGELY